jgi:acyl-CoA synthetase (NDP forming)
MLQGARARGRSALLETEGIRILEAFGIRVPAHAFVAGADAATRLDLAFLRGARAVVKVNSPDILHKSDVGGVAVVDGARSAIIAAVADMEQRFAGHDVAGYTIHRFVPYPPGLGHELLLGLRWTDDFGTVIAVGAGGVHSEFLSGQFRRGRDVAVVSARVEPRDLSAVLGGAAAVALATGDLRGQARVVSMDRIVDAVRAMSRISEALVPEHVREIEVNPLVAVDGELWALDVLVKVGEGAAPRALERPLHKLRNLLEPRSIAVVGVSAGMNPGRVILTNLLRDGFDPDRIYVVKPGADAIDGCRCVPNVASLPERVDVIVLSIDASQAAHAVADVIERRAAESIIVIPGGFEEKRGSEERVERMYRALAESRASEWGGPLINGGNCLGIQSRPGRYDTLFIPAHKIGAEPTFGAPIAFISQSGAFAVSKNSKLAGIERKYTITLGNQMDVTIGDYLTHLEGDDEIAVYAVYAEGFKPLDGLRFLEAARAIADRGGVVVLYRAGRTRAGARASASHTASIAGDYTVTRQLALGAGVVVADTIADFENLVMMFSRLHGKHLGRRLGAVSNAGFECVAIADNLGRFELAVFTDETRRVLGGVLDAARIGGVVDVHNPLDLTPMMQEDGYEAAIRAVLGDPGVDVGVVACVPLTPALSTLERGEGHGEDVSSEQSLASRIARIVRAEKKAVVAVVDGGPLYDAMASRLSCAGVPTFRTADRALRLLGVVCDALARSSGLRTRK